MIFYLIFWVALVYMAILYQSVPLVFLAGAGFFLPLFLYLILCMQCFTTIISAKKKEQYLQQDSSSFLTLDIENNLCFPIRKIDMKIVWKNCHTGEKGKENISFSVESGKHQITKELPKFSYGVWKVTGKKIRFHDFLCLFSIKKKGKIHSTIIVFPQLVPCNIIRTEEEKKEEEFFSQGMETQKVLDASVLEGVREYRQGDCKRDIHWKLSAKKDMLLVKEYGFSEKKEILLAVDVEKLTEADSMVVYSILDYFVKNKEPLVVIWREKEGWQSHEILQKIQRDSVMAGLMTVQTYSFENDFCRQEKTELLLQSGKLYVRNQLVLEYTEADVKEKLEKLEIWL